MRLLLSTGLLVSSGVRNLLRSNLIKCSDCGPIVSFAKMSESTGGAEKLSKNELKRRLKMEKKAQEKAEKEKAKEAASVAKNANGSGGDSKQPVDDEDDPDKYYDLRLQAIFDMKARGENPFPHKYHVDMSIPDFLAKYSYLKDGK